MIFAKRAIPMRLSTLLAVGAIALLTPIPPIHAQQAAAPGLEISQAWSRATPASAPVGVGYLALTNRGAEADRLLGGATEVAARVEVHEMSMDGGVMKMREVAGGLEIKPGERRELKPGGHHLMLIGLKRPLKEGERFRVELKFEKAGAREVEFAVQGMGAAAPAQKHHHH